MNHRLRNVATATALLLATACGTAEPVAVSPTTSEVRFDDSLTPPPTERIADADLLTGTLPPLEPDPPTTVTTTTTATSSTTTTTAPSCQEYTITSAAFESGIFELTDSAKAAVARVRAELDEIEGDWIVDIIGHTDSVPTSTDGGNDRLSLQRAEAVASELKLPQARVGSVEGRADSQPVATGSSPGDLAKNRRVELFVRCG